MQGRVPGRDAFAAYRLSNEVGLNQKETAKRMQRELKRPVSQSTVSRWLRDVKDYLGKENPMPRPEQLTMDPNLLEQGPRLRKHGR